MHETSSAPTPHRFLVILAAAIVLLPFSGCLDDDGGDDALTPTLLLSAPSLAPRNDGTGELHDATLSVNKVTPGESVVEWSDVKVTIKSAAGSVLLPLTSVREDTGTYGSDVEVWYSDTTGQRDRLDAGDAILITGMEASEYEGGYVYVFLEDERVGDTVMPTDFP